MGRHEYVPPPCRYVPKLPPAEGDDLRRWKRWARAMRAYLGALRKAWLQRERQKRGDPKWWPGRQDRHPYLFFQPHTKQAEFIYGQASEQYAFTGNRGAKTWALGWKGVFGATGIPSPWFLAPKRVPYLRWLNWARDARLPWIGIITSHSADSREKAIGTVVTAMLPPEWVGELRRDNQGRVDFIKVVIGLPGEQPTHVCDVLFFAQTQTEAAIMGISANWAIVDEELKGARGDIYLAELIARLSDRVGYLWYGFTPVDSAIRGGATKIVQEKIQPARLGKWSPQHIQIFQWSTHDNTHLTPQAREEHDRKYRHSTGEPRWDYALRVLGEPVGAGLSPAIAPEAVEWQRRNCVRSPLARGRLVDTVQWKQRGQHAGIAGWHGAPVGLAGAQVQFIEDRVGKLEVFRYPETGHYYALGCDTGTGTPGGNPTAAVVLDRNTGEVVALLHGLIDAAQIVPELIRLGHWYNTAWMCVEKAHAGYAVLSMLAGTDVGSPRYPKLYIHDRPGDWTDVTGMPGYPMGVAEQAFMLQTINAVLSTTGGAPPIRVPSERIVNELGSAQYDEKGKLVYPSVEEGEITTHCDALVALGLAVITHRSPACLLPKEAPQKPRLSDPVAQRFVDEFEELEQRHAQRGAWRESSAGWRAGR